MDEDHPVCVVWFIESLLVGCITVIRLKRHKTGQHPICQPGQYNSM